MYQTSIIKFDKKLMVKSTDFIKFYNSWDMQDWRLWINTSGSV